MNSELSTVLSNESDNSLKPRKPRNEAPNKKYNQEKIMLCDW